MTGNFYNEIKGFHEFSELSDPAYYTSAPEDWYVAATDVKNSTIAVSQGKYKEVNLVSAATIIAILNIADGAVIPYVFGGDGATILLPAHLVVPAQNMLAAVQAKVQAVFGLEMRAGLIPLKALYQNGAWLKVAKFQLSDHVSQAVFQGTALSMAEKWLKTGDAHVTFCHQEGSDHPNLAGLECRWQPVPNRHGEIVNLLVKATSDQEQEMWRIYDEVLGDIHEIYSDLSLACPTHVETARLSLSPRELGKEARLRNATPLGRLAYLAKTLVLNAIGKYCLARGKKAGPFDGGSYLPQLVANSDFRKCDEMLRMVIDGKPQQREALEKKLRERMRRGEIVYGLHSSSHALMTCLVFSLSGNHVHFVDGANGGYAFAALQMKQQLADLKNTRAE